MKFKVQCRAKGAAKNTKWETKSSHRTLRDAEKAKALLIKRNIDLQNKLGSEPYCYVTMDFRIV